jgi:transposase InsO family protein
VSHVFGQRWRQAGIDISMGPKGSALDNAVCESFFRLAQEGTHPPALLARRSEPRSAIFEWIEAW